MDSNSGGDGRKNDGDGYKNDSGIKGGETLLTQGQTKGYASTHATLAASTTKGQLTSATTFYNKSVKRMVNSANYEIKAAPRRKPLTTAAEANKGNIPDTYKYDDNNKWYTQKCPNCEREGCKLQYCAWPLVSGLLPGCPLHNTLEHTLDSCGDFAGLSRQAQFEYVVASRAGRAPVNSVKYNWIKYIREDYESDRYRYLHMYPFSHQEAIAIAGAFEMNDPCVYVRQHWEKYHPIDHTSLVPSRYTGTLDEVWAFISNTLGESYGEEPQAPNVPPVAPVEKSGEGPIAPPASPTRTDTVASRLPPFHVPSSPQTNTNHNLSAKPADKIDVKIEEACMALRREIFELKMKQLGHSHEVMQGLIDRCRATVYTQVYRQAGKPKLRDISQDKVELIIQNHVWSTLEPDLPPPFDFNTWPFLTRVVDKTYGTFAAREKAAEDAAAAEPPLEPSLETLGSDAKKPSAQSA